jgi:transglutaminase-like putative cysteine protease
MRYFIRHITHYRYSAPIRESIMEARMRPRSDGNQRCVEFRLDVTPRAKPTWYHDHLENVVHHFDIPGEHQEIFLLAESTVEVKPLLPLPDVVAHDTWREIDALAYDGVFWDLLQPSAFVQATPLVDELAATLQVDRRADPLTTVMHLNRQLYETFSYVPQSTRVDSTIDEAIAKRRGVCQDFSHIMIALVRRLGIPCRYVSGYLYHRKETHDRSEDDASHAWVEVYLPGLCWRGFDPTNNLVVGDRHIRVAAGCDYADVPPTRGVFKGLAATELGVSVRVSPDPLPITPEEQAVINSIATPAPRPSRRLDQQQQQQ